jgi:hypothetical protein
MAHVSLPGQQTKTYLLLVKKAVRVVEHLAVGDEVMARLQVASL